MLFTFVDKLSGLFDRRFIIAFWAPVMVSAGLAGIVAAMLQGPDRIVEWWTAMSAIAQAVTTGSALLAMTTLAYLLQAVSYSLVQWFEAYWPGRLALLSNRNLAGQKRALDELTHRIKQLETALACDSGAAGLQELQLLKFKRHRCYPADPKLLRASRLGNIMTAAEEYSYRQYGLDAALWWPRLTPLLPQAFAQSLEAAVTPFLALINLCALLGVLTVALCLGIASADDRVLALLGVAAGGCVLAVLAHEASLNQALLYGDMVRVAFDLYRQEILKQMHIKPPDNLGEERILWLSLNAWMYYRNISPNEGIRQKDVDEALQQPFYYDTHESHKESDPTRIEVRLKGGVGRTTGAR